MLDDSNGLCASLGYGSLRFTQLQWLPTQLAGSCFSLVHVYTKHAGIAQFDGDILEFDDEFLDYTATRARSTWVLFRPRCLMSAGLYRSAHKIILEGTSIDTAYTLASDCI